MNLPKRQRWTGAYDLSCQHTHTRDFLSFTRSSAVMNYNQPHVGYTISWLLDPHRDGWDISKRWAVRYQRRLVRIKIDCSDASSVMCNCTRFSPFLWIRIQSVSGVSGVRIRIRGPDPDFHPDHFQNLTGYSLFQVTFVVKFSWRSDQSVRRYESKCGKMPSQCWRILQKNSWIRIRKRMT